MKLYHQYPRMLIELYIEALLVDEELADLVWTFSVLSVTHGYFVD